MIGRQLIHDRAEHRAGVLRVAGRLVRVVGVLPIDEDPVGGKDEAEEQADGDPGPGEDESVPGDHD